MASVRSQYLFAYGTLRAEESESNRHGPKRLSSIPAKAPGRLYSLKEGYPILLIEPGICVLTASHEWKADWGKAQSRLETASFEFNSPTLIEGELCEIPLEPGAFDKPDAWEGFSVGSDSVYQRMVIPVRRADGVILPSWVYGCAEIPAGATPFEGNRWKRPEGL